VAESSLIKTLSLSITQDCTRLAR